MARYRVLVIDDHTVVREGLSAILRLEDDIEVVGGAGTTRQAVELATTLRPDIILMDVRLDQDSGIEACREIKALLPKAGVLMLTSYSDDDALFASLMAGASGYLLKNTGKAELLAAIQAVGRGDALLDPAVTQRVIQRVRRGPSAEPEDDLSEREREVLALVAEGMTNKDIAERLYLSDHTVRNHVSHILQKLGLSRRTEAVAYALRRRLVEPS